MGSPVLSSSRRASRVAGPQRVSILLEAAGVLDVLRAFKRRQVTVNGHRVRSIHARADPLTDTIALDGRRLEIPFCRYIIFHKPYGVISHFTGGGRHATLADFIPVPDVYAAGRLDWDSEGLLFLTDDGWLIHRLTDPRFGHPRTYWVQVERVPSEAALAALRRGVVVQGRPTRPAIVRLLDQEPELPPRAVPTRDRPNIPTAWLEITLAEGRTRQVRHMTAAVGHPTLRLVRVRIGPLTLTGLAPGQWRELTEEELQALRQAFHSAAGGAPEHTEGTLPFHSGHHHKRKGGTTCKGIRFDRWR